MRVPVVNVRIMRVRVNQPGMLVPVCVRFAGRIVRAMRVLMMLVMDVAVLMRQRLVDMLNSGPPRDGGISQPP